MDLREKFEKLIIELPETQKRHSYIPIPESAFIDKLLAAVCEERGHQTVSIDLPIGSGEACLHCNYLERMPDNEGKVWEGEWNDARNHTENS